LDALKFPYADNDYDIIGCTKITVNEGINHGRLFLKNREIHGKFTTTLW